MQTLRMLVLLGSLLTPAPTPGAALCPLCSRLTSPPAPPDTAWVTQKWVQWLAVIPGSFSGCSWPSRAPLTPSPWPALQLPSLTLVLLPLAALLAVWGSLLSWHGSWTSTIEASQDQDTQGDPQNTLKNPQELTPRASSWKSHSLLP